MLIMGAHEMLNFGATVTGTVDGSSYSAQNLCDGDPHNPIRTATSTFSFSVTGASALAGINGIAITHHNLDGGLTVSFSGLGNVTTLTVPPNDIRLNPYTVLTPAGSVSATTVALGAGSPGQSGACVVGEAFAGIFREVRSLPIETGIPHQGFGISHPGEFGGMAYSKGGEARMLSGTVWVNDASQTILLNAYRASRENSRPTLIVPYYVEGDASATSQDAWVVTWESYEPRPIAIDLWQVSVSWMEVSRLRWPA